MELIRSEYATLILNAATLIDQDTATTCFSVASAVVNEVAERWALEQAGVVATAGTYASKGVAPL